MIPIDKNYFPPERSEVNSVYYLQLTKCMEQDGTSTYNLGMYMNKQIHILRFSRLFLDLCAFAVYQFETVGSFDLKASQVLKTQSKVLLPLESPQALYKHLPFFVCHVVWPEFTR